MGLLGRFLTGDVVDEAELDRARTEGIVLHLRRLRASVAYDRYRAPGVRSHGRRLVSSGGVLVTSSRAVLWAAGVRQLDLSRETLPSPSLDVRADPGRLQVSFSAEDFHHDRSGQVRVRLRTTGAERVAELLTR
ncbi:MAG: hypothetical protein M3237_04115 [Actinomycetota bacterium]|nr:hypothetical protein [Actinomycetota bacterium]